ncbi:MAG: hypothetical protein H6765_00730 [Candidatus Peribacteria bacterium]|nr:MAG: hypothetical protein H6765_00730 [Candidatus Peribacteria bacterium]
MTHSTETTNNEQYESKEQNPITKQIKMLTQLLDTFYTSINTGIEYTSGMSIPLSEKDIREKVETIYINKIADLSDDMNTVYCICKRGKNDSRTYIHVHQESNGELTAKIS